MTERQEKENETCFRTIISLGRSCLLEPQTGSERWESYVSYHEQKLKDTSCRREIKVAGLEALVLEELEKHLISIYIYLYIFTYIYIYIYISNRLRTLEDARLGIVTFVEAVVGLRIRGSKPSESGARRHSDPVDDDAISFLASCTGEGKGTSTPPDGSFKCGGNNFSRRLHFSRHTTKASNKGESSKIGLSGLENPKSQTRQES